MSRCVQTFDWYCMSVIDYCCLVVSLPDCVLLTVVVSLPDCVFLHLHLSHLADALIQSDLQIDCVVAWLCLSLTVLLPGRVSPRLCREAV
jgi:hypothetical protein